MGLLERIRSGTLAPDDSPPLVTPRTSAHAMRGHRRIDDGENLLMVAREFLDQAGRADTADLEVMIVERPDPMRRV